MSALASPQNLQPNGQGGVSEYGNCPARRVPLDEAIPAPTVLVLSVFSASDSSFPLLFSPSGFGGHWLYPPEKSKPVIRIPQSLWPQIYAL